MYALITPMAVVCTRSCNNTSDSPCAIKKNQLRRSQTALRKVQTDSLGSLPNPENCIGIKCEDAIVEKHYSKPLLETFDYYIQYLERLSSEGVLTNDVIYDEAVSFLKIYAKPLKVAYQDIREEGYFDVKN